MTRNFPEIIEYSGFLSFAPLSDEQVQAVEKITKDAGLEVAIYQDWLEFEYSGRDTNRFVVSLLNKLSEIIGTANGEVVCELCWEDKDSSFEFYSIQGGQLLMQKGQILRDKQAVITEIGKTLQAA